MDFEYQLHLIDDRLFEILSNLISERILGIGTFIFSANNDGGRDGRFEGKAIKFPSEANPWTGKFILQSKHTISPIARCSDGEFRKIIDSEIPKIIKLVANGELDNYLIFTNRTLTATEEKTIRNKIQNDTKVKNNCIFGKERINLFLNEYPEVAELAGLDKYLSPLTFYEEDIKLVILYFKDHLDNIANAIQAGQDEFKRTNLEEKNKKNKLSEIYFNFMINHSLSYFHQIYLFLKDPKNKNIQEAYLDTVSELNSKILEKRKEFGEFDGIFNYIYDYITKKNTDGIKSQRRLIYIFLHFMYYNCDIGIK